MFRFLIVGLILSVSFSSGVFAQSGSKNSHGKMTSTMSKKQERQISKLKTKLVSQFVKTDFAEIKLTKEQRKALKGLVGESFEKIYQIDSEIGQAIPADKTKALMRAWKVATKAGESNSKAMATSMKSVGLPEDLQKKILGFNASKEKLLDEIRSEFVESLDDDQKEILAKVAKENAAKEAEANGANASNETAKVQE